MPFNEDKLKILYNILEYEFKTPILLEQAFTRRSAIEENISTLRDGYQRLEFLGDKVLGLVGK